VQEVKKTVKVFRIEDEREDYSWALALDDSKRLEIASRLVCDLWSAAHDGSPFPQMDRTVCRYIQARPIIAVYKHLTQRRGDAENAEGKSE